MLNFFFVVTLFMKQRLLLYQLKLPCQHLLFVYFFPPNLTPPLFQEAFLLAGIILLYMLTSFLVFYDNEIYYTSLNFLVNTFYSYIFFHLI
jgi:hypothetical protein